MAVRKIRIWPDPALKEVAKPVTVFDETLKVLVADMFETMYKANGVGLAATQIAVPQRVLVIDLDPKNKAAEDPEIKDELTAWGYSKATVFINPQIIAKDGEIEWEEGCLSVPGITEKMQRFEHIVVRSQKPDGEFFDCEAHGLFAVALQHEMDHLEGKVFVEYLSKLKRDVIKRKMQHLLEEFDDGVAAAAAL